MMWLSIKRDSTSNYSFDLPRYSVLQEPEQKVFIPYDGVASGTPLGAFQRVQSEAITIKA